MLKLLTFPGSDDEGNIFVQKIIPAEGLTKEASHELHPSVSKFVSSLTPDPNYLYVLINALGAGEYYGSNINGDYFEESELFPSDQSDESGYKTFTKSGVYRHHKNKDIQRSMGKVVCSVYNPVMHRVELIVRVARDKAEEEGHGDLVRRLDEGENPAVSMGCRVKYDVCSICGNKSKTRKDYCSHTKHMMNKMFPDGRKVFVFNPKPKFFDISFVVIGADRTSYAMAKVASAFSGSSALAAEETGLRDGIMLNRLREKLAGKQKRAKITKQLPAMAAKVMPKVEESEPEISKDTLNSMASHPLRKILTTTGSTGIVLRPKEYQRIILIKIHKSDLADRLDNAGQVFPETSSVDKSVSLGRPSDFSGSIRNMVLRLMPQRSMFDPMLTRRIVIIKSTPSTKEGSRSILTLRKHGSPQTVDLTGEEEALLEKISAGYNGYRIELLEKISHMVDNITKNDIRTLSAIGDYELEGAFMSGSKKKEASGAALAISILGALPLAYLYAANVREKRSRGDSEGALDKFVEGHPVMAASILVGLTRMGAQLARTGVHRSALGRLANVF